ncbi:phosphotransferase family protein [Rummeliibacillus sp. JY-2-4R]
MDSETIPIRKGEELDCHKLETYLKEKIPNLPCAELEIRQFGAGKSNLTYEIKIGSWEAVLRRPPLGVLAPKAHDMKREYTILNGLHTHFNKAPEPYLLAEENILGSPFFIMERKHGIVLDTKFPESIQITKSLCRQISEKMVDTLVDLHNIDYRKTKLKEMTRPDGFMERQVHSWIKRFEKVQTENIKGLNQLKSWMITHIPKSPNPTVIHYDFKLNNSMFNHDFSEIVGIFDWEMTTVGDPLIDLGVAMSYWIQEDDSELLKREMDVEKSITSHPGFMTRQEFIESYAKKSGRDVSNMHFYLTFAYFKLAVICQQIYYRYYLGQTVDQRFAKLNEYVRNLIYYANETSIKRN